MRNKVEKIRKKICNKIITFVFKNKINNRIILKITIFVYNIISKAYAHEPEYRDECHHYISQFILKNFKINNTGEIYEYSNESNGPKKKSIKTEVACIQNLYASVNIKTQKKSLYLEKEIYELIETCASHIIKDVVYKNYNNLTDPEKSVLAIYTAYQYTRTPAFRAQLKNFILFLVEEKNINLEIFSNKHKKEITDIFLQNSLDVKRHELVEFNVKNKNENRDVEKLIRKKLDNLDSLLQLICVQIGNDIAENIFRKKLSFLKAKEPYYLILPDGGVIIYDFEDEYNYFLWPYGWNLKKKSVAIFLPISPDKCLLFSCVKLDEKIEEEYIKLTILLAYHQRHKYIYSNRRDDFIQKNLNKFPRTNYFN